MSDTSRNNFPEDSIEETRRKKMEEFRLTADRNAIRGEAAPEAPVPAADEPSGGRYSADPAPEADFSAPARASDDETQRENFDDQAQPRRRRNRVREINSYSDDSTKKRIERDSKKALKQQKKEEKKIEKSKAKRNRRIFKFVWISMIVLVGIVLSQYILVGVNDLLAISREDNPAKVNISIPENPKLDDIADILYKNRVIKQPGFFKMYASFTSSVDGFRQGDFEIETDKDYEAIINFLQSNVNRTDIVTVQITEGMNVQEIAKTLSDVKVLSDINEFYDLCNSTYFDEDFTFLKGITNANQRYYKLEGYLFPDTYDFYVGENPKSVISKFLNNYENKIVLHKEKYFNGSKKTTLQEEAEATGYSMDEILTIASIIQAEAASRDDMYYISSILQNRLEYGVDEGVSKLNCDCTVYYPYRKLSDIPESDRATFHSTYDTNDFDGLPPGPICNPGVEAIKAAIKPYESSFLYFCHDSPENGSTPYYATTIQEHEYNLSIIENNKLYGGADSGYSTYYDGSAESYADYGYGY
nr:endolytic transglycosylase MltG [uncultured Ruminococcus sp.]